MKYFFKVFNLFLKCFSKNYNVIKIYKTCFPKEVRSFLGLCSYYRKFIFHFANIARPLHKLTEKNQSFVWTEECQMAFENLKQALTNTPILAYPRNEDSFILDTDASNTCMGAVLSQIQDGKEKVIAYYSKAFSRTERKYCVTRRELLAAFSPLFIWETFPGQE
jgi:hypothetical protein